MAKELLTAHKIRAITKAGTYKDGGGLRLVVTAQGTKRWELWISIKGKRRELGLGVFPEVSLRTRATRRTGSSGLLAMASICVRSGPSRGARLTFRQAFDDYFGVKRQQLSNAKHLKQWPSTMETYVFPFFGDVRSSEVTTAHVLEVLKPIWFEKPETAKRVLQRIEAVFKSAILRGSREKASPCVGVADHLGTRHREQKHHAALPWQDVPEFVAACSSSRAERAGQRRGWHSNF